MFIPPTVAVEVTTPHRLAWNSHSLRVHRQCRSGHGQGMVGTVCPCPVVSGSLLEETQA